MFNVFFRKVLNQTVFRRFYAIKRQTNGYLSPRVYRALYSYSRMAQEGVMLDIGPAQGASSIALALGIRDSGKFRSKLLSIEKGENSEALRWKDDPLANKEVLSANIAKWGLEQYSTIVIGDVSDVYRNVEPDSRISLIFIDADGALDRDFSLFYNRALGGAVFIIDDCVEEINRRAREKYLRWTTQAEMDQYLSGKGISRFRDACPLGKEYTTFRFVQYFVGEGLLVEDKIIDRTFFGYKPDGVTFNLEKHGAALEEIRRDIERQYYRLNPALSRQGV